MASSTQAVNQLKSGKYQETTMLGRSYVDAYLLQGTRRDSSTGLDYHDARWYDPNAGSWISRDPGGFVMGDANLYRAMGNALTDYVDPSGLIKQPRPDIDLSPTFLQKLFLLAQIEDLQKLIKAHQAILIALAKAQVRLLASLEASIRLYENVIAQVKAQKAKEPNKNRIKAMDDQIAQLESRVNAAKQMIQVSKAFIKQYNAMLLDMQRQLAEQQEQMKRTSGRMP